jgi:hypothetical protein
MFVTICLITVCADAGADHFAAYNDLHPTIFFAALWSGLQQAGSGPSPAEVIAARAEGRSVYLVLRSTVAPIYN